MFLKHIVKSKPDRNIKYLVIHDTFLKHIVKSKRFIIGFVMASLVVFLKHIVKSKLAVNHIYRFNNI